MGKLARTKQLPGSVKRDPGDLRNYFMNRVIHT